MSEFKTLGLNAEIMEGLSDLGFTEPSPIQAKAIPFLLKSKKDLIALAQTGTGKTAAFTLPMLNQIDYKGKELQTIIISPTRELCLQTYEGVKEFGKHMRGLKVTAVYGGERIDKQINSLRRGTHVVVGTPGRVHDLIRKKVLRLENIRWVVLDEADEMLDMGFKEDLDAILEQTPESRQTLLFSATMSRSVANIAKKYMRDAEEISMGTKNIGADDVSHEYYLVQGRDRFEALKRVIDSVPNIYGIVFCRTKNETQEVADKLRKANYDAEAMHGDVAQAMRTKIMKRFKTKQIKILVATDVAARGIDVKDLSHVINYNLPDQSAAYTHRSGRTGRAGNKGTSVVIVSPNEASKIRHLEAIIGKKIEYKKVPSGEQIFETQISSFIAEVNDNADIEIKNSRNFSEIAHKLDKTLKENLITYIINERFGSMLDGNTHTRDLNARPGKSRSTGGYNTTRPYSRKRSGGGSRSGGSRTGGSRGGSSSYKRRSGNGGAGSNHGFTRKVDVNSDFQKRSGGVKRPKLKRKMI